MGTYTVVGLQSGDEAKGKVCDYLLDRMHGAVRYSGSCNTGASVVIDGVKHKFHHLPVSAIRNLPSFIASDCLLDPRRLLEEIEKFSKLGFDVKNLFISPDCHVITQDHIDRDVAAESSKSGVGSTKRGVSPCASDKYGRKGTRLEQSLYYKDFKPYLTDISKELTNRLKNGDKILMEGSQGALLDINHGFTYPHISTSSNVAQMAYVSSGVSLNYHKYTYGVFKPYVTKVGTGPFMTEIRDSKINDLLVEKGGEYGTTTGRRRKVGWLDLPMLKYAARINGVDGLAMCKFDVLEGQDIQVCTKYSHWLDDTQILEEVPVIKSDITEYNPIYTTFKKVNMKELVEFIEKETGLPIDLISTGPGRHDMIECDWMRRENGTLNWNFLKETDL